MLIRKFAMISNGRADGLVASDVLSFTKRLDGAADSPLLQEFITGRGYRTVNVEPAHHIYSRLIEVRPPMSADHIRELGETLLRISLDDFPEVTGDELVMGFYDMRRRVPEIIGDPGYPEVPNPRMGRLITSWMAPPIVAG